MDEQATRHPPQGNEPRVRTLDDGPVQKRCGEWGLRGDHYRVNHPAGAVGVEACNLAGIVEEVNDEVDAEVGGGFLARLRSVELA